MTSGATTWFGAVVGAGFAAGLVLLVVRWWTLRRPSLMSRVAPYARDLNDPAASRLSVSTTVGSQVAGWLTDRIDRLLGGTTSVQHRLDRLADGTTVAQFRGRQLVWGVVGFGLCLAAALWWSLNHAANPISLLVLCVCGAVAGMLGCDSALTSRVKAREGRMRAEFPAVADLLALAVAAGEGPVSGLDRVVRVCNGALADELARVLGAIRTGSTVSEAFADLADRTGVPVIARFAEGVAVAVDRGSPLVDVLHAQAADVREAGRRELVEIGGRKEVAMMIPVVFLILPVTVVFAFYPGLVALHLSS